MFRLSGETSTGNGVYLQGDPHSASLTELWQTSHPTSSGPDPQLNAIAPVRTGYHPLNRVHQSLSGDVRKRERTKSRHQRESRGEWTQHKLYYDSEFAYCIAGYFLHGAKFCDFHG